MESIQPIGIESALMSWLETESFFERLGKKLGIEETLLPGMISLSAEIHDLLNEYCPDSRYGIAVYVFETELMMRFQFGLEAYKFIQQRILDDEQRVREFVNCIADSFAFHDALNNVDFQFVYIRSTERVQEERRKILRSYYKKSKINQLHNDTV